MKTNRMHVLALALLASGVAAGVSVAQTQHQNGLGQTYSDAASLGSPGNQSSYTQVMAQEAANSWPQTGTVSSAVCNVPRNAQMVTKKTATSCAAWTYTGPIAGHVHLNTANNNCMCPSASDPTWN
jgi:hypothetical protein